MRILFFSDIHGITDNLKIIDRVIKEKHIDKLVCLGDIYYSYGIYDDKYNIDPQMVLDFLNKHKDILICMKGNCDSLIDINMSNFPILDGLSVINVDGINIYITHGHEYNYYKKPNKDGILVYGHEHIPYIKQDGRMKYVNVGSISMPRMGNKPTYMIYENKTITIYDIDGNIIDNANLI